MGAYHCQNCVEFYGVTDIGLFRKNNEDNVGCYGDLGLGVVADGVGGYLSGQIASQIAVDQIYKQVFNSVGWVAGGFVDKKERLRRSGLLLRKSIENINTIIHQAARDEYRYRGMSTTIVAFLIFDNTISIAHVGDSRAYLFRDGRMSQLTKDHSLVQSMIDRGSGVDEQKLRKKHKNLLLRALGANADVGCTVWEEQAKVGDLVMMCSDGIHGVLENEEIESLLSGYNGDLRKTTDVLIREAKRSGSRDNMSVVVARITKQRFIKPDFFSRIFRLFH
ncbi:MAG: protein phosphatase 2C domain-containing protein [Gammaproteobacteria bacterium]|nr:protein phosphatase 2C domain-containing protein [Gammaproteobacteria bacterium]